MFSSRIDNENFPTAVSAKSLHNIKSADLHVFIGGEVNG